MQVRLLGTGAGDGWPTPCCTCSSCLAAARAGAIRGQTSALVDGRLLLDPVADGARTALRQGTSLQDVGVVLFSEQHDEAAWQWRDGAAGEVPLTVLAPGPGLAAKRHEPRTQLPVAAGDSLDVSGYRVQVLAAGDRSSALIYDLTGPDGVRLLWAAETGPLPPPTLEHCAGAGYDLVALGLACSGEPGHLDLTTWPAQVAALRRAGAVTDRTTVCAVQLGHGNPPPLELDRVLASWGACAPRDGTVLELPAQTAKPTEATPHRLLVLGGARSGKSAYAEQRLAAAPSVTYLATAPERPGDDEWSVRIAAHRARRPAYWSTLETQAVSAALRSPQTALLIDDLGLWLTSELDAAGWARDAPASFDAPAVERAVDELVDAWRRCPGTAVLVVPEVGGGVVPSSAAGRLFRDRLGALTTRLAQRSDEVVQVVAGLPRWLR